MTLGAVGRKLIGSMAGVGRCVVVGLVTAYAGIRRVVVVAIVAGRAVIGNGCVRAVEWVIIVVDGEFCRHPAIGGVASFTSCRDAQNYVIWVGGGIEIRLVTADTSIGCVGVIAADVAIGAVGHISVCAREWPYRVMIKCRRYPTVFIVTLGAVR